MSDNLGTVTSIFLVGAVVVALFMGGMTALVQTHVDTVTSCTTTYVGPVQ